MSTETQTDEQEQTDVAAFDTSRFEDALKQERHITVHTTVVDGDTVGIECYFKAVANGSVLAKRLLAVAHAAADALDGATSVEAVAHCGNTEVTTVRSTFEAADLEALAAGELDEDAFRLQTLGDLERVI